LGLDALWGGFQAFEILRTFTVIMCIWPPVCPGTPGSGARDGRRGAEPAIDESAEVFAFRLDALLGNYGSCDTLRHFAAVGYQIPLARGRLVGHGNHRVDVSSQVD
jgi:hypothetical protein